MHLKIYKKLKINYKTLTFSYIILEEYLVNPINCCTFVLMIEEEYIEVEKYWWKGTLFSAQCMGYKDLAEFAETYLLLLKEYERG